MRGEGWLVFVDDFNSLTWEKVNTGKNGPACADTRNMNLDARGLDSYGRWYWTPTREAFMSAFMNARREARSQGE